MEKSRSHFENAKRANEDGNFRVAAEAFEASYVLIPKHGTLVSLANMYLKMGNRHIDSELYNRLLEDDDVPQELRMRILQKLSQIAVEM